MFVKLTLAIFAFLAITCTAEVIKTNQVVCYFDSKGCFRKADATFSVKYLVDAVPYCNYLIYGFAGINIKDSTVESLHPDFEIHQFKAFKEVISLKESYPDLRILISVGGGRDHDHPEKYLSLLESHEKRHDFVSSAITFAKAHGFDGVDLAWQFPHTKAKVLGQGFWSSTWSAIKKPFVSSEVDPKSHEHKQQFVELVSELKKSCRNDGLLLSLSVLPNINSTLYFNIPHLIHNVDFVNLWAFDFYTGERNPKEADLPAPLYEQVGRQHGEYAEHVVEHWCHNGAPSHKLFLGLPTFARTWKSTNPNAKCFPPLLEVDGPGLPGVDTKEPGLLSFTEIYHQSKNPLTILGASTTVKTGFPNHKYTAYGLFPSHGCKHRDTWAGYEDPDTAAYKSTYAHNRGLGGIAVVDVTLDDFRGLCLGVKYPLLRAVSHLPSGTKIPVTTLPSNINLDLDLNKPALVNVDEVFSKPSNAGSDLGASKPSISNLPSPNEPSISNLSPNQPPLDNLDLNPPNPPPVGSVDPITNQPPIANQDLNLNQGSIGTADQSGNQASVTNLDGSSIQSGGNQDQTTDPPSIISNPDPNPVEPSIASRHAESKPNKPSYLKSR